MENNEKKVVVKLDNVKKVYISSSDALRKKLNKQPKREIVAVDNVSLEIYEGEIFGLLGANGAGKTTIIKMLCGLIKPNQGKITIFGNDIEKNTEKALENIGAIVEAPTLYQDMTGMQNLKYFAELQGGISKDRIDKIVEIVGLKDRINSKFSTYSLGMQQRLGIAQAIMHNPKLLILDEPINGLDPDGIIQIRDLLKSLVKEYNTTIIISSHILSEMQQTCTRVAFMKKGQVVTIKELSELEMNEDEVIACFTVSDIEKAESLIKQEYQDIPLKLKDGKLYIKTSQEGFSQVNKLLILNDIAIYNIAMKKKSLEDMYKEMSNEK